MPGVSGVDVELGVMSDEQRVALRDMLKGGQTEREIPFARPDSLTTVIAVASGKGGVGKSSVTVNLAMALAAQGRSVGLLDADIYGHSIPAMLGVADRRPTSVEDMILPVPAAGLKVISIGMLKPRRDQVVAWRGPILDRALTQMLADVYWGDLDFLLLDLPPGHRRRGHLAGPEAAQRRGAGGHHAAGCRGRGRRARRHDGVDDESAGDRRDREHVVPGGRPARTAASCTGTRSSAAAAARTSRATLSTRLGYPVPLLAQIPLDPQLRAGRRRRRAAGHQRPDPAGRPSPRSVARHAGQARPRPARPPARPVARRPLTPRSLRASALEQVASASNGVITRVGVASAHQRRAGRRADDPWRR